MKNHNWVGATIEGTLMVGDEVVGLHIQRGDTTTPLRFAAIADRLASRRQQIAEELASLDQWRAGLTGRAADSASNMDYYRSRTNVLKYESEEIDRIERSVRSYMAGNETA